jgi:ATP-dependent DNA helicase DinG
MTIRLPALVARLSRVAWLSPDGEIEILAARDAALRALEQPPLVVHAPATARRLGLERLKAFDLLELFAFVRPARFCLPTPRGLAEALGEDPGDTPEEEAAELPRYVAALLAELKVEHNPDALATARVMTRGGWLWGSLVLEALGDDPQAYTQHRSTQALEPWRTLGEWSEHAPEPPAGHWPVEPVEARARLIKMLGAGSEPRPEQADYASAVSQAFLPRSEEGVPRAVIAEAGTGVGKTLGYLAPATLWAEKNQGAVWVSTYTRNLQHQIDRELDRLYPERDEKQRKVVIRKGRENYLCLLNVEEAIGALTSRPQDAPALGLMARWAKATRDGDMMGGDFPAWLPDLIGRARTRGLADRRGECIYAACGHYHKCFIEKSVRRAKRADIVVANHALVMYQAALANTGVGGADDTGAPQRYVFDEGHHVFDAADSAFSALLSGEEAHDLRRWIVGPEGGRKSRARGLRSRAGDLVADDVGAEAQLDAALQAARALPADNWLQRIAGGKLARNPVGPAESFLVLVRDQVYARARDIEDGYSVETDTRPCDPALIEAALVLDRALERLEKPLKDLAKSLMTKLDEKAAELDTATRQRIEAVARGLRRRAETIVSGWRAMLRSLSDEKPSEQYVDWFSVERADGRDLDVGFHRHWIDPTIPFVEAVARPAHGLLVTSATLTDNTEPRKPKAGEAVDDAAEDPMEIGWRAAEARTGARHLPERIRARVPSPFDYPARTRVLVVNDLRRDDINQAASAYRELFLASGGGALGLFTAIQRLRGVHRLLAEPLERAGLSLWAQHVDGLDTSTLIDIFRADVNSCLLGTDAVRDGVDVPGASLRLIVFDRVPWPRPDILHKARKGAFGGSAYDDRITRLRLKQAYGRLIRRADDTGVFVMLDSRLPSRLLTAFPAGVEVQRLGLAQAIRITREFLAK